MTLRVIGAGLPRTGTNSLMIALEFLLNGTCLHMRKLPGHPFDLGDGWRTALSDGSPVWSQMLDGAVAAVDWPASMFWREMMAAYPNALVLLSVRETPEIWWQSMEATILPVARKALAPDWGEGRDLLTLFERFTGTLLWDDPARLMAAYEWHNEAVRTIVPARRLLEWQATDGWEPICRALELPIPSSPFPWTNRRSEWG